MPAVQGFPAGTHGLIAFIHDQKTEGRIKNRRTPRRGCCRSPDGNVEGGKQYFEGNCSSCHSPTGDLAGVARRYVGLELEKRMLYPPDATAKVTVTPPPAKCSLATLAYLDEFTVGMKNDATGWYRFLVHQPGEIHSRRAG